MPSARVAAAVRGLPETTDFHLTLGREIARANEQMTRDDAEAQAMKALKRPGVGILDSHLDHTFDREEALIRALAALPANSLAGAAVQLAAAARVFYWVTREETPRPEDERALSRLLASALTVMVDAAGLDAAADGINHLASPASDPWRDPYQRLDEIFPVTSSGERDHEG